MHNTVTYIGLLHCLSLYLTPMPQDRVQADIGPNAPHCPSTGVKSVELAIQLPRTQICNNSLDQLLLFIYYRYIVINYNV